MEIISFIDGLLIGMLVVIIIVKIRDDRRKSRMTKMGEIVLTKEQTEKVLEEMLKEVRDTELPIEKEDDNE